MGSRDGVSREAYSRAERLIDVHKSLLDDLIWQLFDFREGGKS
jgi:hypothetical protein